MHVDYEEKTFEQYFNAELSQKASIYFPLGQVQEGVLGVDCAVSSLNRSLWSKLGFPFWNVPVYGGVDLEDVADEMERLLKLIVRGIPPMKVNILFQYKRPELIGIRSGAEWIHWGRKYFRYGINLKQHVLLSHIEAKFGKDALVLYAAPAISDVKELVKLKRTGEIIDSTNFRKASELNGHHRNTYIRSGAYSIACSDPQQIGNYNFIDYISGYELNSQQSNEQFVIEFAARIYEIMGNFDKAGLVGEAFFERMREFENINFEGRDLLFSMLTMRAFREITGIQWLVPLHDGISK